MGNQDTQSVPERREIAPATVRPSSDSFARRALIAGAVAVGVGLILGFLWYAGSVLLLGFAAVLVGVFLHSLREGLRKFTGLSGGWALAVVVLALLVLFGLALWLFGTNLAEQAAQMGERLSQAVEQLRQRVEQYPWGRRLLAQLPNPTQGGGGGGGMLGRLTGVVTATFSGLVDFIIVLIIGLYLAANPGVYTRGVVRLVPSSKHERAGEVLHVVGYTLRWWLIGRFAVMAVNGALTGVALAMLGIPLAFSLGLLTGLLNFIPNLGPILAAIPAVLLALLEGPTTAIYVVILYIVVQSLEGFVLTPLVQERTVSLPPAVILLSQVLLGVLFGAMGVLMATPLAATVFVLVKMLYVEDTLGEPVDVPGEREK